MEAPPPNLRDFALLRQDPWTGGRTAFAPGIPAPESALGLRLRRALPSAQVRSVYQGGKVTKRKGHLHKLLDAPVEVEL